MVCAQRMRMSSIPTYSPISRPEADRPAPHGRRQPCRPHCEKGIAMKIVVIGGTGLIGSKVVQNLTVLGHDVVAASPRSGVDATTGVGVKEALAKADVVVDVSNSPSF